MAEIQGTCDDRFEPVQAAFTKNFDAGLEVGASVSVFYRGEPVVDLWGGYREEAKESAWERDTITNVWSTTKTMTFLCALMLADRGELDFHAKVARYWPEFAAGNKESVEVRHLMGHTSGLSGWTEPLAGEDLANWDKCTGMLAAQEPWWEPGTKSGYHALTQGYLIGEVIRRITGTTIGDWFAKEVAVPLGADFHIGLSQADDERVTNVIPPPMPDVSGLDMTSIPIRTFINPPLDASMAHETWWRRAEIPAANGQGNARSVATVQSIIAGRGEARGIRLLSEKGCAPIFEEQAQGKDLVLGVPLRFGMGYGLGSDTMPIGPEACYWGGYGGSVIVMDLESQLTVAYVMNRMEGGLTADPRGFEIVMGAVTSLANV